MRHKSFNLQRILTLASEFILIRKSRFPNKNVNNFVNVWQIPVFLRIIKGFVYNNIVFYSIYTVTVLNN